MKIFQNRYVTFTLLGGLIAILFAFAFRFNFNSDVDPDRYYHFALSRQMQESGSLFLRQLPQVEGLGWNEYFGEKEFLFHQFTALGYRLGGDLGVQWTVWLFALGAVLIFFISSARRIGPFLAFLVSVAFFFSPPILFRLQMIRPHVLAIFLFVLILAAMVRRRPLLTAIAIGVFCLAYHAFYIPLILLVFSLGADLYLQPRLDRTRKAFYGWAAAGLLAGLMLNPYFPANIVMGLQIAYIPSLMAGELANVGFGDELYPAQSNFLLGGLFLPILAFLLAIWYLADRRAEGRKPHSLVFLFAASVIFLWMSFQSRRGVEYFIPTAAFLFVEIIAGFRESLRPQIRGLVAVCLLAIAVMNGFDFRREVVRPASLPAELIASMDTIPRDSRKRVFNCEWDTTPYLLYARPDLSFVDIMDPSLLYFRNPAAHKSRESLKAGEVADAYGMIRSAFKADFVVCRSQLVIGQMEESPHFRRLFPRSPDQVMSDRALYIFELRDEPNVKYAREFEVAKIPAKTSNFRDLDPSAAEKLTHRDTGTMNYLNLAGFAGDKNKADDALCALVRPSPAAMKDLAGASYLSLGGGRNIRLWINGRAIYNSVSAFLSARLHQVVVPLSAPLKESDRLDLIVCSRADAKFWGLSLSGMNKAEFKSICDWKEALQPPVKKSQFILTGAAKTCVGPLAQPVPSHEDR